MNWKKKQEAPGSSRKLQEAAGTKQTKAPGPDLQVSLWACREFLARVSRAWPCWPCYYLFRSAGMYPTKKSLDRAEILRIDDGDTSRLKGKESETKTKAKTGCFLWNPWLNPWPSSRHWQDVYSEDGRHWKQDLAVFIQAWRKILQSNTCPSNPSQEPRFPMQRAKMNITSLAQGG